MTLTIEKTPLERLQPQRVYLPSQLQIAQMCVTIRSRWSPAERQRRMVGHDLYGMQTRWTPPQINVSSCLRRVRKVVAEHSV